MSDSTKISKVLKIAQELDRSELVSELNLIKERYDQPNKEIVLPLVGEFSSGKTSLINALTDSKNLATASKPTTASIFEVRFGANEYRMVLESKAGEAQVVENVNLLTDDDLNNSKIVRIYDTSTKVPSSTVIVDTPGLSSNNISHKMTLTSYLPFADGILLVVDINQQITKTLLDFVNDTKLANKTLYLILTKSDTKTEQEIAEVKKYFAENINMSVEQIVCVSAANNDLNELYALFEEVQSKKNEIVQKALNYRVVNIADYLISYINEIVVNINKDTTAQEQIDELQRKLRTTKKNIEQLIKDAAGKIEEKSEENISKFKRTVNDRLDSIVQQSIDCDEEVRIAINTIANTILQNYKKDIQYVVTNLARERKSKLEAVPLQPLEALEMSDLAFSEFSHNVNLGSLGHQFDKQIGYATILAAGAALLYFSGGHGILLSFVKNTAQDPAMRGFVLEGLINGTLNRKQNDEDTKKVEAKLKAKEIEQNEKEQLEKDLAKLKEMKPDDEDIKKIEEKLKAKENEQKEKEQLEKDLAKLKEMKSILDEFEKMQAPAKHKDVIETSVGRLTDKIMGKPQRRRAIKNEIENNILPDFKSQMDNLRYDIERLIGVLLNDAANDTIETMKKTIVELNNDKNNSEEIFEQKMKNYENYKIELSTLK